MRKVNLEKIPGNINFDVRLFGIKYNYDYVEDETWGVVGTLVVVNVGINFQYLK